jgi:hypothetical protein
MLSVSSTSTTFWKSFSLAIATFLLRDGYTAFALAARACLQESRFEDIPSILCDGEGTSGKESERDGSGSNHRLALKRRQLVNEVALSALMDLGGAWLVIYIISVILGEWYLLPVLGGPLDRAAFYDVSDTNRRALEVGKIVKGAVEYVPTTPHEIRSLPRFIFTQGFSNK